jgi:hypothetical protein
MSYYVYSITDPETCQPFYIGKGTKDRAWSHLKKETSAKRIKDKINSLRKKNIEPIVQILEDNMEEVAAYDLERNLIKKYGRRGFDKGGILLNICEDNRPPKKRFQTLETRSKIAEKLKGKNKGKIPWNKGKSHKRGAQTKDQTFLIMKKRTINLLYKIFDHYTCVNDQVIKECREKGIISSNAPISEASIIHFFGIHISRREDIPQ